MSSAPGALCVQCRKVPVASEWRPFCSERCRLLDLARWADGEYRISLEPVAGESDADEPSQTDP